MTSIEKLQRKPLTKSERFVLDVIDGKKDHNLMYTTNKIWYKCKLKKNIEKAIETLKLRGLIYKNPKTLVLVRM